MGVTFSPEVARQNIASSNTISPVGAPLMEALQKGSYRGAEVALKSESSKLQDASEELGMSHATHAGHDKKTLGMKSVRQGQGTNIEALSRLAEYYDKLPDMPKEAELKALVETLQKFQDAMENFGRTGTGARPTAEDILSALQQFDPDVTHQFAALDIAQEFFAQEGMSPEFAGLLDQAQAFFEQGDVARDVRAGFAAAVVAKQSAATLETDPATVRENYRAMLRKKMGFGDLFDTLCAFDMSKNFEEAVETFMQAAGQDLAGTNSSVDSGFLSALLGELGKLKKMKTVFESAQSLIEKSDRIVARQEGERGSGGDGDNQEGQGEEEEKTKKKSDRAVGFTSAFFGFCSKATTNIADAEAMLVGMKEASASTRVVFANGIMGLHGEVPDDVMPSPQARLQQATTIRALSDKLVKHEEAVYQEAQSVE